MAPGIGIGRVCYENPGQCLLCLQPSQWGGTLELWQRKAVHVRSRTVLENMEDKNAEKNVDN